VDGGEDNAERDDLDLDLDLDLRAPQKFESFVSNCIKLLH